MIMSSRIRAMEEIGLRELRLNLGPTLEGVANGRTIVVTNTNRPRAVLVPVEEYERLQRMREDQARPRTEIEGGLP